MLVIYLAACHKKKMLPVPWCFPYLRNGNFQITLYLKRVLYSRHVTVPLSSLHCCRYSTSTYTNVRVSKYMSVHRSIRCHCDYASNKKIHIGTFWSVFNNSSVYSVSAFISVFRGHYLLTALVETVLTFLVRKI